MRKTVIRPKKLHSLAEEFIQENPLAPNNLEGGRPKAYPDSLILTIASIQRLGEFSFRETLEYCQTCFPSVPALSSLHERLENFPKGFVGNFIAELGT